VSIEITLIRHAETAGNLNHVWQGQGDSPLTALGRRQAAGLGERLADEDFDLVLASDLGRVLETASLAGFDPRPDPSWREVDIGRWEGLTREQVAERFPEELRALSRGEEVAVGGGETWPEFGARCDAALRRLIDGMQDGQRALVVAHGGVIGSLMGRLLGFRNRGRPWPMARVRNTSLTRLRVSEGRVSLAAFNDALHTTVSRHPLENGPEVGLIRHGETLSNLAGKWQGVTDGELSEGGLEQARALAAAYDGVAHVFSSPLRRARITAEALSEAAGVGLTVRDDLVEVDFGNWEDMRPAEAERRFPEEWRAIHVDHVDIPYGGTGERFVDATARMAGAIASITSGHCAGRVAVVSHGVAIRGYLISVVGLGFPERKTMELPENASVSHVRMQEGGPVLVDYNLEPAR
jgi:broad specificity phosphatase PhoE